MGRDQATSAFDTATCIGCGACVASCRNASASLFVAAKLAHLGQLPQGQPERSSRADAMQRQMEAEGFGSCSSNLECEAVCPQEISADWISWMHAEGRRKQPSAAPDLIRKRFIPLLIPVEAKVGDSFDVPAQPLGSPTVDHWRHCSDS